MASRSLTGLAAGLLAGAAGVTAHDAVTYVHQALTGSASPSSPGSDVPAGTADGATPASVQSAAAGPLGGTVLGIVIGAAAGALRGLSTTPPQPVAAIGVGAAAWASALGAAAATGAARPAPPQQTAVEALSHLAYGVVTVLALHHLLDPRTPVVPR
jgi:hypothetical protein